MPKKRTSVALRPTQARLLRLAESNILGIVVGDLSGKIIDANDGFLKLVGYARQDFESGTTRWDRMTPPEHFDSDRRAVEQLRSTGIALPWEKELLHKSGDRIPVIIGVVMMGESKHETDCVSFVLDISDRKRLEEQLKNAKNNAEAVILAKSKFMANISHEIRTSLNNIIGMTELVLDTQLTSEQTKYLKSVKMSSEALFSVLLKFEA